MDAVKTGKWRLLRVNEAAETQYGIPGEYDTEELAQEAARKLLAKIEETQVASEIGGPTGYEMRDNVYIVRPDGTGYKFDG